jgi:hypothetical protein
MTIDSLPRAVSQILVPEFQIPIPKKEEMSAAKDIEAAIQKGTGYSPSEISDYSQKSMGIDPAFGLSAFGIVIMQRADNQIQIMNSPLLMSADTLIISGDI